MIQLNKDNVHTTLLKIIMAREPKEDRYNGTDLKKFYSKEKIRPLKYSQPYIIYRSKINNNIIDHSYIIYRSKINNKINK